MKYLACAFLALVLTCAHASASTVEVFPVDTVVQPGELFSIDIFGTGFTRGTNGGGINIQLDNPGIASFQSVSIDPIWEFISEPGTINNARGNLTDIGFASFANLPIGDFRIATVFFEAGQTAGSTDLLLSESLALGGFALDGIKQTIGFNTGNITVVPLPASFILLLSGLSVLGIPALRRLKTNQAPASI